MRLEPLSDRVLIRRLEAEEKTPGGLYIPPAAKEQHDVGEVVALGEGRTTDEGRIIEMRVKLGEMVVFSKFAGVERDVDGMPHVIVRQDDILAILRD